MMLGSRGPGHGTSHAFFIFVSFLFCFVSFRVFCCCWCCCSYLLLPVHGAHCITRHLYGMCVVACVCVCVADMIVAWVMRRVHSDPSSAHLEWEDCADARQIGATVQSCNGHRRRNTKQTRHNKNQKTTTTTTTNSRHQASEEKK